MASGAAGLSQRLNEYHRYILNYRDPESSLENIPIRKPVDCLAEGLITAWSHYGNKSAVILFMVYPIERNTYDQRWLEYSLKEQNRKVKVIRRSLKDIQVRGQLTEDKCLVIDGIEVGVVYQRSGYSPKDFDGEDSWKCRLMMERSRAIICPNAGYHLAGTKKVQQVLAQPGIVERFIHDPDAVQRIRNTFAQQFSLDLNEIGEQNVAMAITDPERFVLKPQREGGGNNIYGQDVAELLKKLEGDEERSSYILMERIQPYVVYNYPVNPGQPVTLTEMVSELGIFGTLVGSRNQIYLNKQQGYLLRTKKVGTNEGGIATGFCVLDTPYLVD